MKYIPFDKNMSAIFFPIKDDDADKTMYGKTLVIAGSENIYGACFLCTKSAFLSGSGMVKVFTHINNRHSLEETIPEAMFSFYDKEVSFDELEKGISWSDTIVVGPGLSTSKLSEKIVLYTLDCVCKENKDKIIVFDADALNIISYNQELLSKFLDMVSFERVKAVITPHKRELERFMKAFYFEESKEEFCKMLYDKFSLVTVMKQHKTFIFGDLIYENTSGNEGMATAGSGDVLSGILGGILFRNPNKEKFTEMVANGVFIHGLSGDIASERINTVSLMASDIMNAIPVSFDRIEKLKD